MKEQIDEKIPQTVMRIPGSTPKSVLGNTHVVVIDEKM